HLSPTPLGRARPDPPRRHHHRALRLVRRGPDDGGAFPRRGCAAARRAGDRPGHVTLHWEAAGLSDTGRVRRGNEDAFRMAPERGIFVVADGMGGHAAGEVASRLAADTTIDILQGWRLDSEAAIESALRTTFSEA